MDEFHCAQEAILERAKVELLLFNKMFSELTRFMVRVSFCYRQQLLKVLKQN